MDEMTLIENSDEPITLDRLVDDIHDLGITSGDTLILHSSMSSLGWIAGGAPTVIDAFQKVVTSSGDIVMPTHTGHYADPIHWENPTVPDEWVDIIRNSIPPYRPEITPTRENMGKIAECFRTYPSVHRSQHPVRSFAAWGTNSKKIVKNHKYPYGHDDNSPLADIYELDGKIVLQGVTHGSNTSIHLAEHRADYNKDIRQNGAPVIISDERKWITFPEIIYPENNKDQRIKIGEEFKEKYPEKVSEAHTGNAKTIVLPQRDLVDFSVEWIEEYR
jgi:aminoglycoside 3-N-acetyltransferase